MGIGAGEDIGRTEETKAMGETGDDGSTRKVNVGTERLSDRVRIICRAGPSSSNFCVF